MSVINRVLKDLDRNRALSGTPSGVRAVAAERRRASLWLWIVLAALLLGSAAGFALRQYRIQQTPAPVASPVPPGPAAAAAPAEMPAELPSVQLESPVVAAAAPPVAPVAAAEPPAKPAVAAPNKATAPAAERPRIVKEPSASTPEAAAQFAFNEAKRLIEQGRKRDALDRLYASLQHNPAHLSARQTLVALLAEGGDLVRAEALIREGAALHPNEPWFAQAAAQMQVRQGNYIGAAATLKEGLHRGQADGAYWAFLAGVQNKLGHMDEAAQAYRQAVRLNPDNGTWWVGLAVALERQGHKEEARSAYLQANRAKLDPELKDYVGQKLVELAR